MITYVWAISADNAIERAYDCNDYKELAEAQRKEPSQDRPVRYKLWKVEVSEVVNEIPAPRQLHEQHWMED